MALLNVTFSLFIISVTSDLNQVSLIEFSAGSDFNKHSDCVIWVVSNNLQEVKSCIVVKVLLILVIDRNATDFIIISGNVLLILYKFTFYIFAGDTYHLCIHILGICKV